MLTEHGDDVEADLLETFGVDLLDLGSDRLSWSRLGRLLDRLPPNSRSYLAVRGYAAWTPREHLLAALVDILQGANWQRAQLNTKRTIPQPKPIPRPGAAKARRENRTELTPAQIAARLRAQRRTS